MLTFLLALICNLKTDMSGHNMETLIIIPSHIRRYSHVIIITTSQSFVVEMTIYTRNTLVVNSYDLIL